MDEYHAKLAADKMLEAGNAIVWAEFYLRKAQAMPATLSRSEKIKRQIATLLDVVLHAVGEPKGGQ